MRRYPVLGPCLLVCLLLAGCGTDRQLGAPTSPSPVVTLLDSVKLEEPDSAPLSHILAIQVTADGGLLVADLASAQISEFERSGALRRRIGRKGRGPGEFAVPGAMAVLRDTLLAAVDWQLQRVNFFDLSSGALTRSAPVGGLAYSIAWDGDTLVGALFDPVNYTSQVVLLPGVDSAIRRGTLPAPYRDSPGVRTFFPYFFVASIPDKLVTGFMASNELYVRTSGAETLAVTMPWVARRPVPTDIIQRFSKPMSDSTIIGMASLLSGLFPMGAERLAVIHSDFVLSGQTEHSTSWLSVLDFHTGEACVDTPLGEDPEGSPKLSVRGDTLVRIDLRIGADGTGETWVRRMLIDVERCEWRTFETRSVDSPGN